MSRHWAFKGDMQINCELPTRLRVMGFNAMPCVILDTHGHFSFAMQYANPQEMDSSWIFSSSFTNSGDVRPAGR